MRKLNDFINFLKKLDKVVVAFSGGVDSSTLAALCHRVVGDVVAVTVVSQLMPKREVERARKVAEELGIRHDVINLDVFKLENVVRNQEDRCYYCKRAMLKKIIEKYQGYKVLEGTNADDLKSKRLGYKAVIELGCISPWAIFGFSKEEIRKIAREMKLSVSNAPPQSCLATRIPFGTRLKEDDLRIVDKAEAIVLDLTKVNLVRVRNMRGVAVIEVDEVEKLLDPIAFKVRDELKKLGFREVLLNLCGYRSGKNYW